VLHEQEHSVARPITTDSDEFNMGPAGLASAAKLYFREDSRLSSDNNRPIKRHGSFEYKRHGHVPNDAMDHDKRNNAIPSTGNAGNATVARCNQQLR
jgi:hypothetical protein